MALELLQSEAANVAAEIVQGLCFAAGSAAVILFAEMVRTRFGGEENQ